MVSSLGSTAARVDRAPTCAGIALVALAVLWPSVAGAQQPPPPVTSNRPGIGESEQLLVPRAIQVESGLTLSQFTDDDGRHQWVDVPELTVRFGLTERLELFVFATGYVWDTVRAGRATTTTDGWSDAQLNAKLGLLTEARHHVTLSAAIGVSMPTGSPAFTSDGYDPSLRFLWSKSLPRDWSLGGNLVLSDITILERRHSAAGASLSTGRPITASCSWFVEVFTNVARQEASVWQLDGGLALLTSPSVQLDAYAGRTLAGGAPAWFVSIGLSARKIF